MLLSLVRAQVGPHQAADPRRKVWVFASRKKPKPALGFGWEGKTGFAPAKARFAICRRGTSLVGAPQGVPTQVTETPPKFA